MEKRSEIRDCNFERDTGIGDFSKRDSENDTFLWENGSKLYKENQAVIFGAKGLLFFYDPWPCH